ncbi:DUF2530 domain-containing protein [Agromyces atrinae]|uniref:DUF2530 domain-containing protein n=1 Tax=Agromyces atrinae TaxID=592376 RepID=A0A4Q2M6W5_9MICO|nr:DUF2530 domain-containing protein [Agromyces atrinae]NYD68640.1 Na+-transporting NADH:ubiquinone oxidoreductase subunit NqrE [Agromyces atrinae]RXZ86013.1 DUF2530 domain-containing protein [Agromyces atrinae]
MRLWLRDSERRPDPAPVRADARKAVAVGTGAWLAAFVALATQTEALEATDATWWLAASGLGVLLGAGGLVALEVRRRR